MSSVEVPGQYTAEQKIEILRRHLMDKVPVADLCKEHGISSGMFYDWQKTMLGQMAQFQAQADLRNSTGPSARLGQAERRIQALEAKLARQDSLIADIFAEYVRLKQSGHG